MMKRPHVEWPERFVHETELRVRIADVNYGGHLGNDAVLALLQEARLAFLASLGASERDAGGTGLIMTDATLVYRAQAFHGDSLRIGTAVADLSRTGLRLAHGVVHAQREVEIARASIGLACFDYAANRVARMPAALARNLRGLAARAGAGETAWPDARVEYLSDATVDAEMDASLRRLLTTCFQKPQDHVFHHRRYFIEPYPHRWIIRDAGGKPVAHLGVLERGVTAGDTVYRTAGICDVCVHPDAQRRGYARRLLEAAHKWMEKNGIDFSILFGNPAVYRSSGYMEVHNLRMDDRDGISNPQEEAMVKPIRAGAWPSAEVFLPGKKF